MPRLDPSLCWDQRVSPLDFPARWAAYHPGLPALLSARDAQGHREPALSWGELDARVERLASHLVGERGLRPGDRVAILALNHGFFFELAFACWRAGLVLAPINWRLAPPEVEGVLKLSEPSILFVDGAGRDLLDRVEGEIAPLVLDIRDLIANPPKTIPECSFQAIGMEDPALLLFTSGTTGKPKAAMLPGRQLYWNAVNTALAFELTRKDSTVLYTPLFHTGAINVLAMPLFFVGGSVLIRESFDVEAILRDVEECRISALFGVPTTLQMMAEHALFEPSDLSMLRLVLCGGAPLPVSLIHRYQDRGLTLTQGFGMTEVGPNCFYLPPEETVRRAGTVGKPIHYSQARIVVDGRQALPDEVGELQLKGPHVCLGYFRNQGATAAAIQDGWFHTGDLARQDQDGFFYVAGRAKDMFISGGENVYPAEVEIALAGHPGVLDCAVVAAPDPRWGEVGCAFVVPRGAPVPPQELRLYLRARLAAYKVPKHFLCLDALPRNASGKVVKDKLVEEARKNVC